MSDSPEQKEKHKLARERLRRLRALAKLRRLQAKADERKAKAALAAPAARTRQPIAPPPNADSGKQDERPVPGRDEQRQVEIDALERDIAELSRLTDPSDATAGEIDRIRREVDELKRDFYAHLASWQRVQLARHPQRPYTDDFIRLLFENFSEIHGDRNFADDPALITGMAWFQGRPVLIVGNQKGRDTKQRLARNFGQSKPEGYRKALRAMQIAAKYRRPVFVFVDTPGAYPGIDAEERGQAEAIAHNIREMSRLPVPIVVTITGEGGSGGALAIAVGDRVMMLENSIYSVISPEGCASIMWRDSTKAELAADALKITAPDLLRLKLVDEIVPEPEGGAHTDHAVTAKLLAPVLLRALDELSPLSPEALLEQRYAKFRHMGQFFT
ncbi:MAG TPA: acetyl-CoA carboxylase carboxyltransferase subunit alpha [Candidatus Cybelea sp.]|jgi:acetyl-CoA carboxylase carboxyl transferase subunit alpha|nr:acetyl-CoA carboxylase carboxyltransferase subunit alpha [Candidatus Cybelea sp.]